jgi:hypothetical protein
VDLNRPHRGPRFFTHPTDAPTVLPLSPVDVVRSGRGRVSRAIRPWSDDFDAQSAWNGVRDARDVTRIGGDDAIATTISALDHGHVHDIVMSRPSCEHPDRSSLLLGHRLDDAEREQASKTRLARTASPRLGEDRHGDDGSHLLGKEAGVQCPHASIVAFRRDQCTRVVGDAHELRRPTRRTRRAPATEQRASTRKTVRELLGGEGPVFGFPRRDRAASGVEAKPARCGVGEPRAERRVVRGCSIVDGASELGRKGHRSLLTLRHALDGSTGSRTA